MSWIAAAAHQMMLVQDIPSKIVDEPFTPEIPCHRTPQRPKFVQSIIG
jgi:hypothetical protein